LAPDPGLPEEWACRGATPGQLLTDFADPGCSYGGGEPVIDNTSYIILEGDREIIPSSGITTGYFLK